MQILYSSYLWALLGLAVPIAIHLWSKKQGKTIKVGSIRFLKTSDSQKSKSLQLNELLLLLLRALIICVLVLIIAEPQWKNTPERTPLTYIVEASLLNSPEVKSLVNEWSDNSDVRLLQSGFPEYDGEIEYNNSESLAYYWQLAKDMQFLQTDSIVVLTQPLLKGFKGKRPEISKNIKWIVKDFSENKKQTIGGIRKDEEIELISVTSNSNYFEFQKESKSLKSIKDEGIELFERDSITVYMYTEASFKAEEHYIQASFSALNAYLDYPIQVILVESLDVINSSPTDLLVWLSDEQPSKIDGKILQFKADDFAESLITQSNSKRTFYLTQRLNSENSIKEHLAEQLLEILDLYPELKSAAQTYDKRKMPLSVLEPKKTEEMPFEKNKISEGSTTYLWLMLMVILISERLLARYKKQ